MTDTLYIDSNEPNPVHVITKATIKDRQSDVNVEAKGLKTGDFVYKDTVIERKEASDLASSIKDGRLKEQTMRMSEDFEHQYIIVEGNPYDLKYSNLHDNAFIGTMVSRSYAGIPVIYTPDQDGTAYALNKLIEKHDDGEERTLELERTGVETEDVQVAMIGCIKGISKEKAKKISDKIGSFEDVAQLTAAGKEAEVIEKLQEIEGIGPKLAERVVNSITEA